MSETAVGKQPSAKLTVVWGHLALLLVIAAIIISYLIDAREVSTSIENLLFVQPGALLALILCALVLPQCFRRVPAAGVTTTSEADAAAARAKHANLFKTGALAAAFGAFAVSLETVGFDVATWLFTAMGLVICGERRWWVVALFTTIFTLLLIKGFQQLIPFPFPLRVL